MFNLQVKIGANHMKDPTQPNDGSVKTLNHLFQCSKTDQEGITGEIIKQLRAVKDFVL